MIQVIAKGIIHSPEVVTIDRVQEFDVAKLGKAHNLLGDSVTPVVPKETSTIAPPALGDPSLAKIAGQMAKNQQLIIKTVKSLTDKNSLSPDTGYAKMAYQQSTISKFKIKFPQNQDEFYTWFYGLFDFQTKNGGSKACADILFQRVLDSLSGQIRTAWQQERTRTYQAFVKKDDKVDDSASKAEFAKKYDTIDQIQKFAIKRVVVRPKFSHIRQKFDSIRCFENERPSDTLNRINNYLFQYESLKSVLNPHLTFKLSNLGPKELIQIFQEVFIENNVDIGKLNNKARVKLAAKWPKLESKHIKDVNNAEELSAFYKALKTFIATDLDDLVRPLMDMDSADEDYKWKSHTGHPSLFAIPTEGRNSTDNGGHKRKRSKNDPSGPAAKRHKSDSDSGWCPNVKHCKWLSEPGGCKNKHKFWHIRDSRKKHKGSKEKSEQTKKQQICRNWQRGFPCAKNPCPFLHTGNRQPSDSGPNQKRFKSGQSGPSSKQKRSDSKYCDNGENCTYLNSPRGCRKTHPYWQVQKAQKKLNGGQPSSYSPHNNVNHQGVEPHRQAVMITQDGQQTSFVTKGYLDSLKSRVDSIHQEIHNQRGQPTMTLGTPQSPQGHNNLTRREQAKLYQLLAKQHS